MRYLSLFSGMEAAHIAWGPLGWDCAGVAEIEPAACALLRHRLPHVPNLGSVTEITEAAIRKLGRIDVLIGGSPCQDLSVAGKRAGLVGARSSLFHEQLRIFNAARTFCGTRWLVWENVPGAFSSNKGRDFAVVAGAMAGCELDVPADGWGNEGVALGENGLVEWAVLDSQWFGVAQRRRRVFAVLDTGDWANRPPVLLEPESLRGHSAPSRGEGPGSTVGTLAGTSPGGGWRIGADEAAAGQLIPKVAPTLLAGQNKTGGDRPPGTTVDTCESLIPIAFDTTQITSKSNYSNPKQGDPCHPLCAGAHPPAIAFSHQGGGTQTTLGYDPESRTSPTLSVGQVPAVTVSLRGREGGGAAELGDEVGTCLRASQGGGDKPHVLTGMAVRRLTPRECERLQAAEDDWTLVPNAHGKPMADGPRYKLLGNSFTATVIRWIGRQIEVAHAADKLENAA